MNIYTRNLAVAESALSRISSWNKLLKKLTFGLLNLNIKEANCKAFLFERRQELDYYINSKKNYQDINVLVKNVNIEGSSVTKVNSLSRITAGGTDYGADWEDISRHVRKRDLYQCNESDNNCVDSLQVHHIIPLSAGGSNDYNNLVTLCEYHHSLKHPHMRRD